MTSTDDYDQAGAYRDELARERERWAREEGPQRVHGLIRGRYAFYIICGEPRRAGVRTSVLAEVMTCLACRLAVAGGFSKWGRLQDADRGSRSPRTCHYVHLDEVCGVCGECLRCSWHASGCSAA